MMRVVLLIAFLSSTLPSILLANPIVLQVEESDDLSVWEPISLESGMLESDGRILLDRGDVESEFYRLRISASPPAPDRFVRIPGGIYQRGDNHGDLGEWNRPAHHVHIDAFYIADTPVTYEEWEDVYDWALENGYDFDGEGARGWDGESGTAFPDSPEHGKHPVVRVSWLDAIKWLNAKSEREGRTPVYYTAATKAPDEVYRTGDQRAMTPDQVRWHADGYQLPTEAEWEKAARGGLAGKRWPWGDDPIDAGRTNYGENAGGTTVVKSYAPNDYGLYDMGGNVSEYCWDFLDGDEYFPSHWYAMPGATQPNTRGPESGLSRAMRGGNWWRDEIFSRTANRVAIRAVLVRDHVGFRPVLSVRGTTE